MGEWQTCSAAFPCPGFAGPMNCGEIPPPALARSFCTHKQSVRKGRRNQSPTGGLLVTHKLYPSHKIGLPPPLSRAQPSVLWRD